MEPNRNKFTIEITANNKKIKEIKIKDKRMLGIIDKIINTVRFIVEYTTAEIYGDKIEKMWRRQWASESVTVFWLKDRGVTIAQTTTSNKYGKWLLKENR